MVFHYLFFCFSAFKVPCEAFYFHSPFQQTEFLLLDKLQSNFHAVFFIKHIFVRDLVFFVLALEFISFALVIIAFFSLTKNNAIGAWEVIVVDSPQRRKVKGRGGRVFRVGVYWE